MRVCVSGNNDVSFTLWFFLYLIIKENINGKKEKWYRPVFDDLAGRQRLLRLTFSRRFFVLDGLWQWHYLSDLARFLHSCFVFFKTPSSF